MSLKNGTEKERKRKLDFLHYNGTFSIICLKNLLLAHKQFVSLLFHTVERMSIIREFSEKQRYNVREKNMSATMAEKPRKIRNTRKILAFNKLRGS